jgi:hypothetical protein
VIADLDYAALVDPGLARDPEAALAAKAEAAASLPPIDPWLARRMHSFGASEMGALAIALGREPLPTDTKKLVEDGRKLFARKARAKLPRLTKAKAAERARDRAIERAVLDAWRSAGCPGAPLLNRSTIRHASEAPEQWFPLRDVECHRLTCTPDAWGFDDFGQLVDISIKATWPTYRDGGLLWNYELQSQATCAVTSAAWGVVVTGLGFAREDRSEWGGLLVDVVERDDEQVAELRRMARAGWDRVESLRGGS